jgi:hypothetical protein
LIEITTNNVLSVEEHEAKLAEYEEIIRILNQKQSTKESLS